MRSGAELSQVSMPANSGAADGLRPRKGRAEAKGAAKAAAVAAAAVARNWRRAVMVGSLVKWDKHGDGRNPSPLQGLERPEVSPVCPARTWRVRLGIKDGPRYSGIQKG